MNLNDKDRAELEKQLELESKLFEYKGSDETLSIHEIKKILLKQDPFIFKIPHTGFTSLDSLTDGFEGGELIIVSGPTKHGKTTFCQSLTFNLWRQGIYSLWFSYEMTPRQMISRFEQIDPNLDLYMPFPLLQKGSAWFFNRMLEAKLKHECRVVFIDHLHFLIDFEKLKNPSLELGRIIRDIKTIAKRLNIVVFLVCHLTKVKIDDEPTEQDIRDSSFMAQEADSTFMIWRKLNEENRNCLSVRNHRRTGVIAKTIQLKHFNKRFVELSDYEPR